MTAEPLLHTRRDGVHILSDAARLDQPTPEHFDPAWWREQGRLRGEARGRGSAYFLEAGEEAWVLRHYRRGGLIRHVNHDRYLFTGVERSRPFREARLLATLAQRGLPVPAPVAAMLRRQGPLYQGDLITVKLRGLPLSRLLPESRVDEALFARIGEVIGRFHQAGVFHADLNAHNILVDGEQISLIDFDRGCLRPAGRWQRDNLDRLQRSLIKLLGERWQQESFWRNHWQALERAWQSRGQ